MANNFQPLDYLYRDSTHYQTIHSFYNNQEIERIYRGDYLIYQRRWLGEVILPCFADNNIMVDFYPPMYYEAEYYEIPYDEYYNESDAPYAYPLSNYIENYLNPRIEQGEIVSYEIYQPGNVINIKEYDEENITNMPLGAYSTMILGEYGPYTTKIINSLDNVPTVDDIGENLDYQWVNNILVDTNQNIYVNSLILVGNYKITDYEWEYNEQTETYERVETEEIYYGPMWLSGNNAVNYPFYLYCENSSNLYYNENAFYYPDESTPYYDSYLGKDDLTSGPRYDYVRNGVSLYPYSEYVNVNFNSIQEIHTVNSLHDIPQSLKLPLKIPALVNMSYMYSDRHNLQKAYCGKYTTEFDGAYRACSNLRGKAVCGDNVINMSYAYQYCLNLSRPVCGNNVINMSSAYQSCFNLTGRAACGNNVINMSYAYQGCNNLFYPNIGPNVIYASSAFQSCNNLRQFIITPKLNLNGYGSIYGYGGNYSQLKEVIIERNSTNADLNSDIGSSSIVNAHNFENIIIKGGNNFLSLWNNGYYYDETNQKYKYSYQVKEGYPTVFYPYYNVKNVIIETPNLKDVSGWFRQVSLNRLESFDIPSSVEAYGNTFYGSNIKKTYHNNYGPVWMFNTYAQCINLKGELYIPETVEFIGGIAYGCLNLQSIKFDRNCKIPYTDGASSYIRTAIIGNNNYEINGNVYHNYWPCPFMSCLNVTDIQFSDYMVAPMHTVYSLRNVENIVLYNNDDNTPKDLYYFLDRFNNQHRLNVYVPDSTNENSFNYLLYHDPDDMFIFGDYTRENGNNISWTMLPNGYYNALHNIYILNDYDYINDQYPI